MPSGDPRTRRTRRPAPAPVAAPRRPRAGPIAVEPEEILSEGLFTISDRAWLIAGLVILLLGAGLRLYTLENSPFHNDEGVNGWFLTNLIRHGTYAYDLPTTTARRCTTSRSSAPRCSASRTSACAWCRSSSAC